MLMGTFCDGNGPRSVRTPEFNCFVNSVHCAVINQDLRFTSY